MKTAVYHRNDDVRVEDRPRPEIGPGEILMRVRASGICGSDVMEWYRLPKAPLVLGHEVAGDVAEVGDGVEGFAPGDRIFATHHVPCGDCHYCRTGHPSVCDTLRETSFDPGGFAEYVRVPAVNVERGMLALPEEVSYAAGSFVEPLGCVLRGQSAARIGPGLSVLVLGAGVAGILHVQAAKARGAGPVICTDLEPFRLEAARRLGADAALPADAELEAEVRERNEGRLPDRVILCTGAPSALRQGFDLVGRGGVVLLFAPLDPELRVEVPLQDLWWKEATLTSTYAASGEELVESLDLIARGEVDVVGMVTHRLPLDRAAEGFRIVTSGGRSLKVLLEP